MRIASEYLIHEKNFCLHSLAENKPWIAGKLLDLPEFDELRAYKLQRMINGKFLELITIENKEL